MAMAVQRNARYKARVAEDGRLEVLDAQLVPGTEYIVELQPDLEMSSDGLSEFTLMVAWETMKPWYDTPEEDAAWSYLLEDK
jgi:hypothetical protein